jgi:hypothetical protein
MRWNTYSSPQSLISSNIGFTPHEGVKENKRKRNLKDVEEKGAPVYAYPLRHWLINLITTSQGGTTEHGTVATR